MGDSKPGEQELEAGAHGLLGRPLTLFERGQLYKYLNLLSKWNKVHRLVGSSDAQWLVENVILDSLLFLRVLPDQAVDVADLGSGAGVPGIPIAVVRRDLHVTLIESRRRRVSFLSAVVRELALGDVRIVGERAERVPELSAAFDAVVARCAGRPEGVLDVALTLLRSGGSLLISGPPTRTVAAEGPWITIPGIRKGSGRCFAVYRKA